MRLGHITPKCFGVRHVVCDTRRKKFELLFIRCLDLLIRLIVTPTGLPGGNSEWEPPDPIPNSEVKTLSADGSVGSPHVRVGHRQALDLKKPLPKGSGFFYGEPPRSLNVRGPGYARTSVSESPIQKRPSRSLEAWRWSCRRRAFRTPGVA